MTAIPLTSLRGRLRKQAEAQLGRTVKPTRLQVEVAARDRLRFEDLLALQLKREGITFERQVKLVSDRRWAWDFVISHLAVEVQGGVHSGGRHVRGKGYEQDLAKGHGAIRAGYLPVAVTTGQVDSGDAIGVIRDALKVHGWWGQMMDRTVN